MKKIYNLNLLLLLIYFIIILIIAGCTNGSHQQNAGIHSPDDQYQLVWQDEFDYSGLPDSTKWGYDTEGNDAGWGNKESQYYTETRQENATVENGVLKIIAPWILQLQKSLILTLLILTSFRN